MRNSSKYLVYQTLPLDCSIQDFVKLGPLEQSFLDLVGFCSSNII